MASQREAAIGTKQVADEQVQKEDRLNRHVTRFAAITATTFTLAFGGGVALTQLNASAPVAAAAPITAPSTATNPLEATVQTLLNEREAARQQLLLANTRIQQAAQQIQALQQQNTQLRAVIDQQAGAAPSQPVAPPRYKDDDGD